MAGKVRFDWQILQQSLIDSLLFSKTIENTAPNSVNFLKPIAELNRYFKGLDNHRPSLISPKQLATHQMAQRQGNHRS